MSQPFLKRHKEKQEYNQYWYSESTIDVLCQEVHAAAGEGNVAFLSTPSLYFSLEKGSQLLKNSWLFDFDNQWASDPHFVHYDYRQPSDVPTHLQRTFTYVVIDPPFITSEVWRSYAQTVQLLLQPGGRVLASTVAENGPLMQELFGATTCTFQPSIPKLVYQYNLYCNYETVNLAQANPEVPPCS